MCRTWLASPKHNPLPILFSLRDAGRYASLQEFIYATLRARNLLSNDIANDSWLSFFNSKRWLLIFDGLDEMRPSLNPRDIGQLFGELQDVPLASARLLVTARSHLFIRSDHIWGVSQLGSWYQLSKKLQVRQLYFVVEIQDFMPKQQHAYLRKRLGVKSKRLRELVDAVPGLQELAGRPLLLRLIVDGRNDLMAAHYRRIDISRLYETYIKHIFHRRELQTGVSAHYLFAVTTALAVELFRRRGLWIAYTVLEHIQQRVSPVYSNEQFVNIAGDLLLRREGDQLRFSHQSFFEFFLAVACIDDLRFQRFQIVNIGVLTPEVILFLSSYIVTGQIDIDWKEIFRRIRKSGSRSHKWLVINCLNLLRTIGSKALQDCLIIALNNEDSEVIKTGLKIAGYTAITPKVKRSILSLLNSSDIETRYLAIEVGGLHRITQAVSSISTAINSREPNLRHIGLWALRKLRRRKSLVLARELLRTHDDQAIRAAAEVVGVLQDQFASLALESVLVSRKVSSWTKYYAQEALVAIKAKQINVAKYIESIVEDFRQCKNALSQDGPRSYLRRYVIEAIGERRLYRYQSLLKEIYHGEMPNVRDAIIDAIGEMRNAENFDFLSSVFSTEPVAHIRANIIWAFGNSSDLRAQNMILRALGDRDRIVQQWASWAQAQYDIANVDRKRERASRFLYPSTRKL
jgi:HEAT repeat protein